MGKKSLNERTGDIIFWATIFCISYLIIGFLIKTSWLGLLLNSGDLYDLIRDALTLTAYFIAPVAAFTLFSDWREQHNKQVRNKFGLKVFTQFERIDVAIFNASQVVADVECIAPDEHKRRFDPECSPLMIDDESLRGKKDLILSYPDKKIVIQDEINSFLDVLRHFGFVLKQVEAISTIVKLIISDLEGIAEDNSMDEFCGEYLHFLEIISEDLDRYKGLRNLIFELIVKDILVQLQAD